MVAAVASATAATTLRACRALLPARGLLRQSLLGRSLLGGGLLGRRPLRGRGLLRRRLLRRRLLRRRGLAGEHGVLERLERRDAHATRRLDANRFTGLWVATHTSGAVDARELGEPADRHRLTLGDGLGDDVGERGQRFVGGPAVGFGALGEREHELSAVHGASSLGFRLGPVRRGRQPATSIPEKRESAPKIT